MHVRGARGAERRDIKEARRRESRGSSREPPHMRGVAGCGPCARRIATPATRWRSRGEGSVVLERCIRELRVCRCRSVGSDAAAALEGAEGQGERRASERGRAAQQRDGAGDGRGGEDRRNADHREPAVLQLGLALLSLRGGGRAEVRPGGPRGVDARQSLAVGRAAARAVGGGCLLSPSAPRSASW